MVECYFSQFKGENRKSVLRPSTILYAFILFPFSVVFTIQSILIMLFRKEAEK